MISRWIAAVGAVLVLVLSLSCAKTQKATQKVTLRGGIIMQSGDVKPLVRTKFLVYGAGHLPHVSTLRDSAKVDPDFAEYRKDPDFRKLVHEGQGSEKKG